MQFRLIYEGPLFSRGSRNHRVQHIHDIREHFHYQLKELWQTQAPLKGIYNHKIPMTILPSGIKSWFRQLNKIADNHAIENFRFVPLVSKQFGLACKLDILFLRRGNPGEIVKHGGDLDNRMKTLFDALKIPDKDNIGSDVVPSRDKNPFFVLLEDDALITDVRINTDRLLTPVQNSTTSTHVQKEVHLVIEVETLIINSEVSHIAFGLR